MAKTKQKKVHKNVNLFSGCGGKTRTYVRRGEYEPKTISVILFPLKSYQFLFYHFQFYTIFPSPSLLILSDKFHGELSPMVGIAWYSLYFAGDYVPTAVPQAQM